MVIKKVLYVDLDEWVRREYEDIHNKCGALYREFYRVERHVVNLVEWDEVNLPDVYVVRHSGAYNDYTTYQMGKMDGGYRSSSYFGVGLYAMVYDLFSRYFSMVSRNEKIDIVVGCGGQIPEKNFDRGKNFLNI